MHFKGRESWRLNWEKIRVQSPGLQTECATVGPDLPFQASGSQGTRGLCSASVSGVQKFFIANIFQSCPASALSWGKRTHPGTQRCGAPRAVRGHRRETCLQLQPWGKRMRGQGVRNSVGVGGYSRVGWPWTCQCDTARCTSLLLMFIF